MNPGDEGVSRVKQDGWSIHPSGTCGAGTRMRRGAVAGAECVRAHDGPVTGVDRCDYGNDASRGSGRTVNDSL